MISMSPTYFRANDFIRQKQICADSPEVAVRQRAGRIELKNDLTIAVDILGSLWRLGAITI